MTIATTHQPASLPELQMNWYAVKAYFNFADRVEQLARSEGAETYRATTSRVVVDANGAHHIRSLPALPGIVFICCSEPTIKSIGANLKSLGSLVTNPGCQFPARIPDEEMTLFRLVVENDPNLQLIGNDDPRWHVGQAVRVTTGPLAGAVGHVCRIKGNRRLVVTISGVCAVATGFIPPRFLEPV